MTISAEEIIYRYCMGMLNPDPDYYNGRGNDVRDLNSSILEMLYGGIKTEIGADQARMFVNMVKNLKNTNARNFLLELYRMERKGWRWSEPVMKVRVATVPAGQSEESAASDASSPPAARKPPVPELVDENGKPIVTPPTRRAEIQNAFTRSGSYFGHDKAVTQTFLDNHRAEIDGSLISSSFGGS